MKANELVRTIAGIIDEKQGTDIVLLDLRGASDITDYFIIATGANNRLVDAICDEIENSLRPLGERAFAIEGREDCTWLLMDFGSILVHLFQPEARKFYRLERLWGDAPRSAFVDGGLVNPDFDAPESREDVRALGTDASGLVEGQDETFAEAAQALVVAEGTDDADVEPEAEGDPSEA